MDLLPHLGGSCDAGSSWPEVIEVWPRLLAPGGLPPSQHPRSGVYGCSRASPLLCRRGGFRGYPTVITSGEYHDSLRNGPLRRLTGALKFAVSNTQMTTKHGSETQTIGGRDYLFTPSTPGSGSLKANWFSRPGIIYVLTTLSLTK